MTLQRFLNGMADSRWCWPGIRRWQPQPTQRFPLSAFLAPVLWVAGFSVLVGLGFTALIQKVPQMRGSFWPLALVLVVGTAIASFNLVLIAFAWNRRAARLRAAGLTQPPALPRRRWWQTWLVAPFYTLVFLALTPLLLCLAVNNALGTRAWNRARAELVARGEALTFPELIPPLPPPEQNFAMTPLLRPLFDYRIVATNGRSEIVWADPAGRARAKALQLPAPRPRPGEKTGRTSTQDGRLNLTNYALGIRTQRLGRPAGLPDDLALRYGLTATNRPTPTDEELKVMVITDPAGEVLEYFRRFEPEMTELETASRRPVSQFPQHWELGYGVNLPHLARAKNLSNLFRVRAAARLGAGDTNGAFADALTTLRLSDMLATEPLIISHLVRIAQTAIGITSVWDGLANHAWTDDQLAQFQAILARIDLQPGLALAMRGERCIGEGMYNGMLGGGPSGMVAIDEESSSMLDAMPTPRYLPGLTPHGIFRRMQVNHHRFFDAVLAQIRDPAWPTTLPSQPSGDAFLRQLGLLPATPYTILPTMLAPALDKVQGKAARQNVTARLGETACALERHHLKAGTFPERLDELVPAFLAAVPLDPMTGKPLQYRRTDDGWFRLWSVGLNGRDDGGVMKTKDNDAEGDWVWPVPVLSAEPRLLGGG